MNPQQQGGMMGPGGMMPGGVMFGGQGMQMPGMGFGVSFFLLRAMPAVARCSLCFVARSLCARSLLNALHNNNNNNTNRPATCRARWAARWAGPGR